MIGRGSSSFSSTDRWTYDVFLSFKGEDTRYSFTGNLSNALRQRGINTFIDDEELKRGEDISPSLLKAIEESRISIIVFSEKYASSTWCLDELVKILECMKTKKQLVRPVFYYVDPTEVRHQHGSFEKAMAEHEQKFKNNKAKVQKWRRALSEAANLSGWHFVNGYEFEFIQRIIEEVSSQLNRTLLHVADHPVGLRSHIARLKSLLDIESGDDVLTVGICGIGGIGKTTTARAVYNLIADRFAGSSFLADVRENSARQGLVQLQETLLLEILGDRNIKLGNANKGIPILQRRLCHKKVLLILDDVDNIKQLRALAGGHDWFGPGSRILVTTRDKHLLIAHGIQKVHEVKELADDEALELFSWNAFKTNEPDASYMEISNRVVQYAKGLPLALNIIGSDLFGRSIEEWKSALDKYEQIPNKEVQDVLKVSYENLDHLEREIFLDVACFFKGDLLEHVEKTLDACRFYPRYGIGVLIDKSLVTIDELNRLKMHDLIQDMGREVARQDSAFEPGKRRRLWNYEDVLEVLSKDTATERIEGIMLELPQAQQLQLRPNFFKNLKNLRVLIVRNAHFSKAPKHLPNNLRVLDWRDYPSQSLPADFHPETLVVLNMPHSHLTMDEPFKKFGRLTLMDFSDNDYLSKVPDMSEIPNLQTLRLNNCMNLSEVHDSVGNLSKLVTFSAEGCPNLQSLPSGIRMTSLESLNLGKCSRVERLPDILVNMENIKTINVEGTGIEELPHSFRNLAGLESLILTSCTSLGNLPSSIDIFMNLDELVIENCPQLRNSLEKYLTGVFPKLKRLSLKNCDLLDEDLVIILSCFPELSWLVLSENNFVALPAGIEDLQNLLLLHLNNCKQLREIPGIPLNLQYIDARNCTSLTSQSSTTLLSQAFHEVEHIDITVFKTRIPKWLDHCSKGGSVVFWVRQKFPVIAICIVLGPGEDENVNPSTCAYRLLINGVVVFQEEGEWPSNHVWLFDLRIHLSRKEWLGLNAKLQRGWNHVEISCTLRSTTQNGTVKCCGIHVYKEHTNIDNILFIDPDTLNSRAAYDHDTDDSLEISDDENELDHILTKVLADVLGKITNDGLCKDIDGLEHMRDCKTEETQQEQQLTLFDQKIQLGYERMISKVKGKSIMVDRETEVYNDVMWNSMTSELIGGTSSNKDGESSKAFLQPATEDEEETDVKGSSDESEQKKLKEDDDVVYPHNSLKTSSVPNFQISDKITSRKSRLTSLNKAEPVAKATAQSEQTQAQEPLIKPAESNSIHRLSVGTIESILPDDDSMEAFYTAILAETTAMSPPQVSIEVNAKPSNSRQSEETRKALNILQDFLIKDFSLLLHTGRSSTMKTTLSYLSKLSADDGISEKMKSLITQLSRDFTLWSWEYNDASMKLESNTTNLSKVDKLDEGLRANTNQFMEAAFFENELRTQLANLEEKKRELEEQINAIKADISLFSEATDNAGKRKREIFMKVGC
ncbi:Disease resistance protein [Quillaja saponaria]|uniref:Disease resistance protein n=1 Tax=Quillaja saponaria TaxID=32244 RepID=A0AAD7M761_QUISA|nr:Disease resistance protein [Quillaja saponaria]